MYNLIYILAVNLLLLNPNKNNNLQLVNYEKYSKVCFAYIHFIGHNCY